MKAQRTKKTIPARGTQIPAIGVLIVVTLLVGTAIVLAVTRPSSGPMPAPTPYLPMVVKEGETPTPPPSSLREVVWIAACAALLQDPEDRGLRDTCHNADDIFGCLCQEIGGILDGEGGCLIFPDGYRPCQGMELGISDGKGGCRVPVWQPTPASVPTP